MDRGVGCVPIGLGVKGAGSKNCERYAACWAPPNHRGRLLCLGESGTVVPLLASAASAPRARQKARGRGGGGVGGLRAKREGDIEGAEFGRGLRGTWQSPLCPSPPPSHSAYAHLQYPPQQRTHQLLHGRSVGAVPHEHQRVPQTAPVPPLQPVLGPLRPGGRHVEQRPVGAQEGDQVRGGVHLGVCRQQQKAGDEARDRARREPQRDRRSGVHESQGLWNG